MVEIVYRIMIIFTMIVIGFVCYKIKAISPEATGHLSALILNVTGPCMIISSILKKELAEDTVIATIEMLVGTIVFFALGFLLSCLVMKILKLPEKDKGVYSVMMVARNTGFMGFPISKSAFGNEGLYFMVLSNIALSVYVYSIGMLQVNLGTKGRKVSMRDITKSLLNPCSLAAIVGIILLFAGVRLPWFADEVVSTMGDATIPISMIVMGVQLGEGDIPALLKDTKLLLFSLICLLAVPGLTFLAVNWLPLDMYVKLTLTYAAAFPTMVMVLVITEHEGRNSQLVADSIALSTVMSIVTLPLVTILLGAYFF